MDDLVQFLRDRLNEDERAARAAYAPNWSTDGRRGLHYGVEDGWMTDALTTADADHIARHDPARILREVDAKRRMLDEVVPEVDKSEEMIEDEWHTGTDITGDLVRLLALPYADHPSFKEEWRV